MHEQFIDRVLHCADCDTDFIFTAGEQLFFSDKQFRNDPKRCKPCKSRRSGLAAAAAGLSTPMRTMSRSETRTHCSTCGIETTVPFKPTQGRPVLCRGCFGSKVPATPMPASQPGGQGAAAAIVVQARGLSELSVSPSGERLSPDAALLAVTSMTSARAHSSVATQADVADASRALDRDACPETTQEQPHAGSAQARIAGYPQHPALVGQVPVRA